MRAMYGTIKRRRMTLDEIRAESTYFAMTGDLTGRVFALWWKLKTWGSARTGKPDGITSGMKTETRRSTTSIEGVKTVAEDLVLVALYLSGLFLMLGIGGFLMEFVVPRVPFLARLVDKMVPDDDFEEDDE